MKASKKPVREDWHPADIKAALEKAGWTLAALGRAHGRSTSFIHNAFRQRTPAAQAAIAEAIGVKPWDIWPSRYVDEDQPVTRRPYSPPATSRKPVRKDTPADEFRNGNDAAGNLPADAAPR